MASSVILRNIKQLEKSLKKNIDYIDLNYEGVDPSNPALIELRKGSPVLNALKMWLQSRSTSYIRNAGYGGFLTETIHTYEFSPKSESQIRSDIIKAATDEFPTAEIMECEVKCMAPKPYWSVKIAVRDKITNMLAYDDFFANKDASVTIPV